MNPIAWIKANLMEGAAILAGVLLIIVTLTFSVKLGEKAHALSLVTKDRDALHSSIYAERTGWAARLNQCQTNTASLQAALADQNAAVTALKAQGDAKARAADLAVQAARKEAAGYRASAAQIAAAQATGDRCKAAETLLRGTLEAER